MRLSEYFDGIATKRLSAVEVSRTRSNQREFNGVQSLQTLLGSAKRKLPAVFVYLAEDPERWVSAEAEITWYDARADHPKRTEYRLYFTHNEVMERAREGDLLVVGLRSGNRATIVIAEAGSTAENQTRYLFRLDEVPQGFLIRSDADLRAVSIDFTAEWLLEQMGITVRQPVDDDLLGKVLKRFGGAFPETAAFSAFARETAGPVSIREDPDGALLSWMAQELTLFQLLERHVVAERLTDGFGGPPPDVDSFLGFSLSVQNRRKSRAGRALENHVAHILDVFGIGCTRHARTEENSRPDFLFPSEAAYHDPSFPADKLAMLATKSTCKDRWRQVLAEADRIPEKHLLTLEPGISKNQTAEMVAKGVKLVVPRQLHDSYSADQRRRLLFLKEFIAWLGRTGGMPSRAGP
ncbi:MAG: restriction endonuclease [Planctomycetes bacterium]|nr:restriction endonuclease [Planctomycetota bacterium]